MGMPSPGTRTVGLAATMLAWMFLSSSSLRAEVREIGLEIAWSEVNLSGVPARAMTINGGIPGPTLRFNEGDTARIKVHNRMDVETSIHWHGLLVPPGMDGVPNLSFPPIAPGSTFVYEFPIRQSGTYWYHSHTSLQEQRGVYGSIVILPAGGLEDEADRDHVVLLSDWTDIDPHRVLRDLRRGNEWPALQRGIGQSILGAARAGRLGDYFRRELQRMPAMDIADVSYDRFLANGLPESSLPGQAGETVRLRLIDGSATTYFHVEFAGGPMTVVSADGIDVEPFEIQRLLVGVAETYDVLVKVPEEGSWELRATSHDASGFASVWLGDGSRHHAATVPYPNSYEPMMTELNPRRIFAWTPAGSMGMPDRWVEEGRFDQPGMNMDGHGEMGHGSMGSGSRGAGAMDHVSMGHGESPHAASDHDRVDDGEAPQTSQMDHGSEDHGAMDHGAADHESMHHRAGEPRSEDHGEIESGTMDHHGVADSTPSSADPMQVQDAEGQHDHASMDHEASQRPASKTHGPASASHAHDASGDLEQDSKHDGRSVDRSGKRFGKAFGWLGTDLASRKALATDGGTERPWPPYDRLRAVEPTALDADQPVREVRLTLDGDMERYVWFLNNKPLSASDDIRIREGEVARFIMINRTMMHHPMHLHGHFFRVVNGQGERSPLKHTVNVAPMSTTVIEFDANEVGDWFFHCHLLYHMKAGMARIVSYESFEPSPDVASIRDRMYADPWYAWGSSDSLSHMNVGMVTTSDSRNILTLGWEIGWERVAETSGEATLTWDRYRNRFLRWFVGVDAEGNAEEIEDPRGVLGLRYVLPLNVESFAWVDSDGEFRVGVEKMLHLTPRLGLALEAEYDTAEEWEGAARLSYTLSRSFDLVGQWHSDYGLGAGVSVRF